MFSSRIVLGLLLAMMGFAMASPLLGNDSLASRGGQTALAGDYEIIGYRTVTETQAKKYNEAGTITDDPNLIGTQIGPGTYTIPYLGGWPGNEQSWYCVIAAHKHNFALYPKAWIPEYVGGTRLWYSTGNQIGEYIKKLESSWSVPIVFRMSLIEGGTEKDLQMVIPPAALNENGGKLGIKAQCLKRSAIRGDLPAEWRPVNYRTWANVKGPVQGSPPQPSGEASCLQFAAMLISLLRSGWSRTPLRVQGMFL